MTRLYRRITGRREDFDEVLYAAKQRIMQVNLASEMNVLARRFHRLSMGDWRTRDFTLHSMLTALEEVVAAFPVYRTYVSAEGAGPDDHRYIDWAIGLAKKRWATADTTILDFIHGVLIADLPGHPLSQDVLRNAMQFQQVTGPVMAKAFEDTAFYRYFRLLALNEVGGDPRRFGTSCAAFHHVDAERGQQLAAGDADDRDARHQARRGCQAAHRALVGDAARVGTARCRLDSPQPARTAARSTARTFRTAISSTCSIRCWSRVAAGSSSGYGGHLKLTC